MNPHFASVNALLTALSPVKTYGKIHKIVGLIAEGSGINAPLGSLCHILPDKNLRAESGRQHNPSPLESGLLQAAGLASGIPVEVVGFREGNLLFMPYGDLRGVRPGSLVRNSSLPPLFPVGEGLLGQTLDAFGTPLNKEAGPPLTDFVPIFADPPPAMSRPRITEALDVGVRAINALLTIGKGQRIGIMAGSGVGKSTLMGMMARYTKADVNVIALIGERGREVVEFIEKDLGSEGLSRSVLIISTSDQSPLVRMRAAYAATAVAEYFRDRGKNVLFMMDSVTRFAMAAREIGLAVGEPPTTKGYTPSVFAQLPRLLERAGTSQHGSITGIYTVLVDGDDFNEPIADAVRSILDGHIVLSRELADQAHFPAIDILRSISRVRPDICSKETLVQGRQILASLAAYKRVEDMINIGAYAHGANEEIDKAIALLPDINAFLCQDIDERADLASCFSLLAELASTHSKTSGAAQSNPPPNELD